MIPVRSSPREDFLFAPSTPYRTMSREWKLFARYVQPRTRLTSSEASARVPSMTSSFRSVTLRNLLNVSISFKAAQRALPCNQMIDHPRIPRGKEARLDSSHGTKPDKHTTWGSEIVIFASRKPRRYGYVDHIHSPCSSREESMVEFETRWKCCGDDTICVHHILTSPPRFAGAYISMTTPSRDEVWQRMSNSWTAHREQWHPRPRRRPHPHLAACWDTLVLSELLANARQIDSGIRTCKRRGRHRGTLFRVKVEGKFVFLELHHDRQIEKEKKYRKTRDLVSIRSPTASAVGKF